MTDLRSIACDLRANAKAIPQTSADLAESIAAMLDAAHAFKSSGRYREARYVADFASREIGKLLAFEPNMTCALQAKSALQEIHELPDISVPVSREQYPSAERADEPAGPGPYVALFPVGSPVRVANFEDLEEFKQKWHFHHPLAPEQLQYAGVITTVTSVGFYHGGDPLYMLADTGKYVWHEVCLREP